MSLFLYKVLRRDLLDQNEAPQGQPCATDSRLSDAGHRDAPSNSITGCTEAYLDGPYDIGYSRVERYMDTWQDMDKEVHGKKQTHGNNKKGENIYGMKAQMRSSRTLSLKTTAQG